MNRTPQIPTMQQETRMTSVFRGYNHREIIADGEMYDMKNLSDDLYPLLTVRPRRGITSWDVEDADPVLLTGIHGRDKLVHVRGTKVYYDLTEVTGVTVSDLSTDSPKKIVSMGAYVCIWPDKVYFNTVDPTDCGSMERKFSVTGTSVSLMMCRGDGTNYDMNSISIGSSPPASPTNGKLWLDQSGDVDVLRQYYSPSQEWQEVASVYVKIQATNIGHGLNEYDTVMIEGMTAPDTETQRVKDQVAALNGSYIVYAAGENYVVIAGIISKTMNSLKSTTVKLDRTVPDLDFIVESNNRLWGCKYGKENGQVVNEIRASKLGDFRNWSTFMGISTDSYTVNVGSQGEFTGAVTLRGYPVFFKENCIHKISGLQPSSFQVATTVCRGVQRGSGRSVVVVNETVYYKGRQNVMAYDGNLPVSVSDQLGSLLYSDARAGALGDKYYISMKNANNKYCLFTYNTKTATWYREDNLKVLGFAAVEDELYMIDEEHNTMVTATGSAGTQEEPLDWMAEFGISGIEMRPNKYGNMVRDDIPGSHYLKHFVFRMYMEDESEAELEIMYDSNGKWIPQGKVKGNSLKLTTLAVKPRRCDHLRYRLKGHGEFRLYDIIRELEVGSDVQNH